MDAFWKWWGVLTTAILAFVVAVYVVSGIIAVSYIWFAAQ